MDFVIPSDYNILNRFRQSGTFYETYFILEKKQGEKILALCLGQTGTSLQVIIKEILQKCSHLEAKP